MRYTPFEDIDRLFERMTDGPTARWGPWTDAWNRMDVDVAEYDDEIVVMADLPGFEREEISVTIQDDALSIRAERERESGSDDGVDADAGSERGRGADRAYLHRERRHESISRRIDLPHPVREEDATASYHNGVLTVTLPLELDASGDRGHRIDVD